MNKDEKREFIESACETLRDSMLKNLDKIPKTWDGWELRYYLKEKASEFVWEDMLEDEERLEKYENDVIVHNL